MSAAGPEIDSEVEGRRARLATFLANNPYSKIERIESCIAVRSPWGDDSLFLDLSAEGFDDLIEALNSVILPERFTAIFHKGTGQFEVIYTAYPVEKEEAERAFTFVHKGKELNCKFGASSPQLLTIARAFQPATTQTSTIFRNLASFRTYTLRASLPSRVKTRVDKPISFWISPVDWDEVALLDLANHLNFYMSYYDTGSANLVIHSPRRESVTAQPQNRFAFDKFPTKIVARELDAALLHFWYAAKGGDPARRFLYNYQILEYSSHYIIDEQIKNRMRKGLSSPHVLDDVDRLIEEMVDMVSQSKLNDVTKMHDLLRRAVDPAVVWREIQNNLGFFCQPTKFEGGFEVDAIAKVGWTGADFAVSWVTAFSGALRNLRNGLSHGREQRMASVITPTRANFEKVQSWVPLVSAAASEVMIYRALT